MNREPSLPTRLKAGRPGLGEAAQVDIEQRAAEIAQIDGRDKVTDADVGRAAAELASSAVPPAAPEEVAQGLSEVTAWDDPVDQSGHRVEGSPVETETTVAEQLVLDGIEEADHDIRVAAENRE